MTTSCWSMWPNQSAGQETRYLACRFSYQECESKEPETESTTSVSMTQTVTTRESNCIANCSPGSITCSLYSLSKKLEFVCFCRPWTLHKHQTYNMIAYPKKIEWGISLEKKLCMAVVYHSHYPFSVNCQTYFMTIFVGVVQFYTRWGVVLHCQQTPTFVKSHECHLIA